MRYVPLWYAYGALALLFSALIFTSGSLTAHAQLGIGGQGLSLNVRPSSPEPHTQVTVSLDDYSVNAVGAEIFWFIDGVEQPDLKNERAIPVSAGKLGEEQSVRATLVRTDGTSLSATTVVQPAVVDLILEADSYVPSFYKGRALPGRTSILRATAVVHDGGDLPDTNYTYRWSLGEEVLFAGPVLGRNTATFSMPLFSKELAVEVIRPDGQTIARRSMLLESAQPELRFYEWSPLRGLYQREMSNPFAFIGDETVIYGEPYFVKSAPNHENTSVAWRLNGRVVTSNTEAVHAVALNRETLGATGRLEMRMVTEDRVPQLLEKAITIVAY